MKRSLTLLSSSLLVAALFTGQAHAGSQAGSVAASATLTSACTIGTNPLAFGSVNGLLTTTVPSTTTLTASCSVGTAYAISMDAGIYTSRSTTTTRDMYRPAGGWFLPYKIFQDSGSTKNWGNTVGTDVLNGTGNGAVQTYTVYGVIQSGVQVVPGDYSDTITATVTY